MIDVKEGIGIQPPCIILFSGLISDVESQYTGARIEGEDVTLEFVKNMMEDFKARKCLHKRLLADSVDLPPPPPPLPSYPLSHVNTKHWCLCHRYAFQIVLQTRDMLRALPSLVDIDIPNGKHFTVCGDVHGQVAILSFEYCSLHYIIM